jgi:hypothetical protein
MRWPNLSALDLRRRVTALPSPDREAAHWFLTATDRLALLWTGAMLAGLLWGDLTQVGSDLLASLVGAGGALLLRRSPWLGSGAGRALAVYWLRWVRLVPFGLWCSVFWGLSQLASYLLTGTPPGSLSLLTLPGALLAGQTAGCLLDLLGAPPPRRRQGRRVRWGMVWRASTSV